MLWALGGWVDREIGGVEWVGGCVGGWVGGYLGLLGVEERRVGEVGGVVGGRG